MIIFYSSDFPIFSVIYFCENDSIRNFMIRACFLGMCNGEYVFIYPWLHPPPEQEWKQGDEFDEVAKEAYKYMIHVRLQHYFLAQKSSEKNAV